MDNGDIYSVGTPLYIFGVRRIYKQHRPRRNKVNSTTIPDWIRNLFSPLTIQYATLFFIDS